MLSDIENIVQLLEHETAIDDMVGRLHRVHAVDAETETLVIASQLRWTEARVMAHVTRLRDVWRAAEDPRDSEAIVKALAGYRQDLTDLRPRTIRQALESQVRQQPVERTDRGWPVLRSAWDQARP